MYRKVRISVFGPLRDPIKGGNSPQLRMYFSLVRYFESSNIGNEVEMDYVDTTTSEIDKFPNIKALVQKGSPTPMVAINGVLKYSGYIPFEQIYEDAERMLGRA